MGSYQIKRKSGYQERREWSTEELKAHARSGKLSPNDFVRRTGGNTWHLAVGIPTLAEILKKYRKMPAGIKFEVKKKDGDLLLNEFEIKTLQSMARSGKLDLEDSIRKAGRLDWHPVKGVSSLAKLVQEKSPDASESEFSVTINDPEDDHSLEPEDVAEEADTIYPNRIESGLTAAPPDWDEDAAEVPATNEVRDQTDTVDSDNDDDKTDDVCARVTEDSDPQASTDPIVTSEEVDVVDLDENDGETLEADYEFNASQLDAPPNEPADLKARPTDALTVTFTTTETDQKQEDSELSITLDGEIEIDFSDFDSTTNDDGVKRGERRHQPEEEIPEPNQVELDDFLQEAQDSFAEKDAKEPNQEGFESLLVEEQAAHGKEKETESSLASKNAHSETEGVNPFEALDTPESSDAQDEDPFAELNDTKSGDSPFQKLQETFDLEDPFDSLRQPLPRTEGHKADPDQTS